MVEAGALFFLVARVLFCGEILAASAVDLPRQGEFDGIGTGGSGATAPGIIVTSERYNKQRCLEVCGDGTACKQSICYRSTPEQCSLAAFGPADLLLARGATKRNESCSYNKTSGQDCIISTYRIPAGVFDHLFPFPPFDGETFLDFAVQAISNAIVSLSSDKTYDGIKYEFVLGQNRNTLTTIRRNSRSYGETWLRADDGVLSEHKMSRFWLRYHRGTLAIGKHGEQAYLEWSDPTPPAQPVRFLGLGSWSHAVNWEVYGMCPTGPPQAGRATCCVPLECNDKKQKCM